MTQEPPRCGPCGQPHQPVVRDVAYPDATVSAQPVWLCPACGAWIPRGWQT